MFASRDAAGMSLGAIQHQFPTKAKRMAAVAAEFAAYRNRIYAEAMRADTRPRQSMENLIDANYQMVSRPEMAAVLEIHFARGHFGRSEEHTSELQSLMRISYAVFSLTKKK